MEYTVTYGMALKRVAVEFIPVHSNHNGPKPKKAVRVPHTVLSPFLWSSERRVRE